MDESIQKTLRVVSETAVVVAISVVGWMVAFWYKLPRRGFICNDPRLSYPYVQDQVISLPMLFSMCLVPVHVVVVLTELYKHFRSAKSSRRSYSMFNTSVSSLLVNIYLYLGVFWLGDGLTFMAFNVIKETAGHLRPHFFDACHPIMPGNTTCADPVNQNRYILDYECTRNDEGVVFKSTTFLYQSFPSGHASLIFYAMTFLFVYVDVKWKVRSLRMWKALFQAGLILLALFVSVTRLRDHWHHFEDVVGGIVLGVVTALFITKVAWREHAFSRPKTKKDYT